MENMVYNELIQCEFSVAVGGYDRAKKISVQKEIDFIVHDRDRRIYIQSVFQINMEQKRFPFPRESLISIDLNHP